MSKQKKAIVSVTNDLFTDQRVDKVCLFLEKQGYLVTLVGRKRKNSIELTNRSYKTKRFNLIVDKGALFYAEYNFRLFWFLFFKKADLLVSNDLDTLLANYAASKFKPFSELVYDSHEYFTEVPELIHRKKIKQIWEGIEAWIFPKLKRIYTVNDSIAKLYSKKYKKEIKVVRNISNTWIPTNLKSKKELGLPEDKKIIIIQGAGINIDRGAEEAVESMKNIQNAVLIIVGDGDVVSQLKIYVSDNQLDSKVLFFDKRPYLEMMNYTFYADLGLTLDKPTNINYRFSLPNKVFDYIHAETPILSTDLVEIASILKKYDVGEIISDFTPSNLALQITSLLENEERLSELKHNCIKAKETLNWETETEILKEIYPAIED
jgi:glycosyltransferase involved in cell wall biosynthesis